MATALSIIIPVYNTVQYLPQCIGSILSQSFTDFELLLIDDGSEDGSGLICDEYARKDSRVRVFHKDNGGVSSARNLGLDKAAGEWVTFIDSDDYVLNGYLSVPFDDSTDLYAQNWKYANGRVKDWFETCVTDQKKYRQFLNDNIHNDMFRTVYGFFFKRKILYDNDIKFDIKFRLGEDTLFVMDYYRYAKSIRIMDNSCYIYNRQTDWNNKYCLSWDEAIAYLDAFMDRYDLLPCESMTLLDFMFSFIRKKMKHEDVQKTYKWFIAKPVLRYKKKQIPYYGIKFRIKYYLAKTVSVLLGQ